MKRLFVFATASIFIFSSCREIFAKRVRGNGNITMQPRNTGSFNTIHVSGDIDVYVTQDPVTSVKVETDENLQEYLEVYVSGGELKIKTKEGYNIRSRTKKVHVSSAAFEGFIASGACSIFTKNQITSDHIRIELSGSCDVKMDINSPRIDTKASGASSISLRGQARDFTIRGSGSTDVRCFDLVSDNVDIHLSGAGDAEVYASTKLNAEVSGAADIKYKGNPAVSQKESGASSIKKVD